MGTQLKFMILKTLGEEPCSGYQLVKKINESTGWKPSYGSMYPLLEGMSKAQDEIVRDAKKIASDGKLTKNEMAAAKSMAWEHAKLVAVGLAKKIVIGWGIEKVGSLIKQLLTKKKK